MEYSDVKTAFTNGKVVNAKREEIEEYMSIITRERLTRSDHEPSCVKMMELARDLLAVRVSQEISSRSLMLGRLSLYVAILALLVTAGQLTLAYVH